LVCARGGNMPADCSQSPLIGRWAGKRVLVQGDYAEDGDIPNWDGPRLSTLYRAMVSLGEREPWDDMPEGYWDVPVFTDISQEACAFLEGACNVRYFEQTQQMKDDKGKIVDTWTSTHFVKVKPTGKHFGNCGVAEYVIDTCYDAQGLEWLKRCGLQPIDTQRAPRSGDWHGIRPEEIPEGQRRVIVNLDSLEYLDPVKFGQEPTLAGMVCAAPTDRTLPLLKKVREDSRYMVDIAGALFAMLCHPQRRGGGDIPANAAEMGSIDAQRGKYAKLFSKGAETIKGRWRGGHILGTSEIRHEDWPTTEEVIERGTDISDKVIRYLVAVSHY
ncbi:MAG TPA: hypothetical protein VNF04_16375, partial [Stellaceae bacterium]|nr:hypothetical protein [Stellaceae bacterium]